MEEHDAAEMFEWDLDSFEEWRRPFLAEATSAKINRDVFQDTRLMGVQKYEREDVQAIPVYQGPEEFNRAKTLLVQTEEALMLEIVQRLPVPDMDTPLENLVKLRENPAFRNALEDLLEWKRLRIPGIAMEPDRETAIAAAMRDFDKLTIKYAEAMDARGFKKIGTVGSIFFSLFTGQIVEAIKEGLVEFQETREPCWKKVSEMKCAPGGVIYHFKKAF